MGKLKYALQRLADSIKRVGLKIKYCFFKFLEKLKLVKHITYSDIIPSEVKPFGNIIPSRKFSTDSFAGMINFNLCMQSYLNEDYFCSKDGRILFDYKKSMGEESVRRLYVLNANIGNIYFVNYGKYIDLREKKSIYEFKLVDNTFIYNENSEIDNVPVKVEHFSINTEALDLHKNSIIAESGEEITDDYLSVLDMYIEEAVISVEKYLEDNKDNIILERRVEDYEKGF